MRKTSYNGSNSQTTNQQLNVSSNFKFQTVERLNNIVGEITQRSNNDNNQNGGYEEDYKQHAHNIISTHINPSSNHNKTNRLNMSSQVLDMIKNRIKTNYDKLYENYENNKHLILKQIQKIENNNQNNLTTQATGSGENNTTMNFQSKGLQTYIKQKSTYDKTKAQLQGKQKKLKKLLQIRDALKGQNIQVGNKGQGGVLDILQEKARIMDSLEQYRQTLDYQTMILNNMKSERREILLFLKQNYSSTLQLEQNKKQRLGKLQSSNYNKKASLHQIQQTLRKQSTLQIPQNLAEQLQRKMIQYQNKHTYQNIKKHELALHQTEQKKFLADQKREKQQQRKLRLIKQKQDKKQYEIAYNYFLIKQQEQQKIKKICGVSSLKDIVNNNLQNDYENLDIIKQEVAVNIQKIIEENEQMRRQIDQLLQLTDPSASIDDLLTIEKSRISAQQQLQSLQLQTNRKYSDINEWHRLVQLMHPRREINRQGLVPALSEVLSKIKSRGQLKQRRRSQTEEMFKQKANERKTRIKQEFSQDNSVL